MSTDTEPAPKVVDLHRRPAATSEEPRTSSAPTSDSDEERKFRLLVQLDLQRERELLYKVLLVIEAVIAAVLAREWLLWLFG